jgi:Kef-type K+ transport system membrane component KefB
MRHHLPSAGVDLVLNAAPGAIAAWLLGLDGVAILCLAGVTYISSSGVIARLLEDLQRLGNRETPAVLSVLVLEDVAMAAYLPLFAVVAAGGGWLRAVAGMALALGAVVAAFAASYRWGHHVGRLVEHPDSEQLLLRVLGITLIVAAVTAVTKVATGIFAARRDGVARRGQLRAGTALIARGEFSLIIIGLAGKSLPAVAALATSYVFVMAILGPVLARYSGGPRVAAAAN